MSDTRRRSAGVTIGLVTVAVALVSCGGPDYRAVCADRTTGERFTDRHCEDGASGAGGGGGYGWYYLRTGTQSPAVGRPVSGGSFTAPDASVERGGVSVKGGSVERGGFSGWAKSIGG